MLLKRRQPDSPATALNKFCSIRTPNGVYTEFGIDPKFFVVIAIIVVLVILLTPVRMNLKDGGSVRYKALVYEVTKIHRLAPEVDGVKPYIDGFEIKILGMTVYRETNE